MKIIDYSILEGDHTFLDLQIQNNEKVPNIIRIFDEKKKYTHYLYADFKECKIV